MANLDSSPPPRLLAVDWGTSRFRAFLLGADGGVLAESESEDGIARLSAGEHAAVFERHCGAWRAAHPATPVLLVGMVGSRNGWIEAPYAELPAALADLARGFAPVPLAGGGTGWIVPGLIRREGRADVARGEEVLAIGAAPVSGRAVLCLPGTHSKWLTVEEGRLTAFSTFVTGELYALIAEKSFVASLAAPGESPAAFSAGIAAATIPEGLTASLFTARAGVLASSLPPEGVRDYLSGLLIGSELAGARAALAPEAVTLVASGALGERYLKAAAALGLACRLVDTRAAFIAGALRLAEAAGLADRGRK